MAAGAYLIWDVTALWWLAPLAVVPLYLVAPKNGRGDFSGGEGPYTPPDVGGL